MEVGEPVAPPGVDPPESEPESEEKEPCKRIYLHAFRGDRTPSFLDSFNAKVDAARNHQGPDPTMVEVLIWSGHVGVSFEATSPIYGFNPHGSDPVVTILEKLKAGDPYPGAVTDDTAAFDEAKQRGLPVVTIEFVYPESRYNEIKAKFDAEKSSTAYNYSFPGGGGDCNCATFPARVGVPVPEATGNMKLYMAAIQKMATPQRRGQCEG